jgi:serine/threonine protein phosphatase PrpC
MNLEKKPDQQENRAAQAGREAGEMEKTVRCTAAFGMTITGRRDHNEDALLCHALAGATLLAVADGVGGHAAGEVASSIAIRTLRREVAAGYREGMDPDAACALLREAFNRAHTAICEEAVGARRGMGTTLVAAIVTTNRAMIAWCGDSRAYVLREDGRFRTADHSLVQPLVDRGLITGEEARVHPMRHVITHSLGGDLRTDCSEQVLQEGDVVLLSTDGLHDSLPEETIRAGRSLGDGEAIVRMLVTEASGRSSDNITAVALRAGPPCAGEPQDAES